MPRVDSKEGVKPGEPVTEEPQPEGSRSEDSTASPGGPEIADALRAARMSGAGVLRDYARARVVEALFGGTVAPDPVKLDRFVILDKLGRGAMGVVYSAYDPELDRQVALKLLQSSHHGNDPDARARLVREAQALARLSHPNVVPVYDVGVIHEQVFIVMELVAGRDLCVWRDECQRDWRAILDAYLQAGCGLAAAHQAGLVHRDFKPENVLMGEDGRVRVLDFGLARGGRADQEPGQNNDGRGVHVPRHDGEPASRAIDLGFADTHQPASQPAPGASGSDGRNADGALLDVAMTETGAILGTPMYMSPEQFLGRDVGQASDQFSFCVSLFEALYGKRPFAGTTLAEFGASLSEGKIREPTRSSVPGRLLSILRRGLATQPDDRYPSMNELLEALRHAAGPVERYRWLLTGVGVAAFAVAGVQLTGLAGHDSDATVSGFPPVQVMVGIATASGDHLEQNSIRSVLRSNLSAIKKCYASAWGDEMPRPGGVTIQFDIGASGRLIATRVIKDDFPERGLASCIGAVSMELQFPVPRDGTLVRVRYPFRFRPMSSE